MMGYFPETFNKEERCLLPALSLPLIVLNNQFNLILKLLSTRDTTKWMYLTVNSDWV